MACATISTGASARLPNASTSLTLARRIVVHAATAALDDDNDTAASLYTLAAHHYRGAGDEAVLAEVLAEDCVAVLAGAPALPLAA